MPRGALRPRNRLGCTADVSTSGFAAASQLRTLFLDPDVRPGVSGLLNLPPRWHEPWSAPLRAPGRFRGYGHRTATPVQMLDAAHGACPSSGSIVQGVHSGRVEPQITRIVAARDERRRRIIVAIRADAFQGSRLTAAGARSRRFGAIARRNAAEREQNNSEFTTLRLSESKDRSRALPSKSKVKPRRGLIQNAKFTINGFSSRVRFQRCHSEEHSDEESVFVSFHGSRLSGARAAASPGGGPQTSGWHRACPTTASESPTDLLCHSERSGSTNAASAEAACGLCRARRRKTNAVQSNICIVSIQILRRSAPQNDKLLNCSQTPQQTGISNWRQRRLRSGN